LDHRLDEERLEDGVSRLMSSIVAGRAAPNASSPPRQIRDGVDASRTTSGQPARCTTGRMNLGARDRDRTGDPQLGNVTGAAKLLWNSS
jgi:hypothetical protein